MPSAFYLQDYENLFKREHPGMPMATVLSLKIILQ